MASDSQEISLEKLNSTESWSSARRYASLLGPIPSSVKTAVRKLWADHETTLAMGHEEISSGSFSAIRLIDKSAVLKTPLYFAAQSLYPEKFEAIVEDDGTKAVLRVLGPGLFASLLTLVYLHRRFNKICSQEAWQPLSKEFVLNMELGFLIGSKLSAMNPADSVLAGGLRTAAQAIYLRHDQDGYSGYRNRDKVYDVTFEHGRWGCDHGQVAGMLAKTLGLPYEPKEICNAIRARMPDELSPELKTVRTTVLLLNKISGSTSSSLTADDLPSPVDSNEMLEVEGAALSIAKKGSRFEWMFRRSASSE